ncbi:MAG: hypothetical protein AAGG69_04180 [Pseudomonadota bacterium]
MFAVCMGAFGANLSSVGTAQADASRDKAFFSQVGGMWRGPGEIVAGKYKGTKFSCTFQGAQPGSKVGMTLDGKCRVGVFTQDMKATLTRTKNGYQGQFLDGARGEGLDVVAGNVTGDRAVMRLKRKELEGAMLVRLAGANKLNVTISVDVNGDMVPVIGMSMDRIDGTAVGAID